MANCMAVCTGIDSTRNKTDHRLGHKAAEGKAQTYKTFAVAFVKADGSGYISVRRNTPYDPLDIIIPFGPEDQPYRKEISLGEKLLLLPAHFRNKLLKEIDNYYEAKKFDKVM